MKKIIRNIVWYFYYLYDRIKCWPNKSSVEAIDNRLSKQITLEIAQAAPKKIIIFATYEKVRNDPYIEYFLSMIESSLVIIINNTSNKKYEVETQNRSVIWVNRPNFGRDISSYKLGIRSVVRAKSKQIKDLALINDSLYILKSNFFEFFNIEYPEDILAHSYSTEPRPHTRSYLMRLKPKVLESLDAYLDNIPFAKSRYNAVINGELGMSKNVLLKYKIGLWAYSGIFKRISSAKEVRDLDLYDSNFISKKYLVHLNESLASDIKEKIGIDNFLKDPYELGSSSRMHEPDVIKREVYEKGLASKAQVFFSIENSDLTECAKSQLLKKILISKRYIGIKNRFKLAIGEI
jgi:hypothetical protein